MLKGSGFVRVGEEGLEQHTERGVVTEREKVSTE